MARRSERPIEPRAGGKRRYVVVPNDNAFNKNTKTTSLSFLSTLSKAAGPRARSSPLIEDAAIGPIKVLGRVDLNESTLVEMTDDQARELAVNYPSLRIAPEGVLELFKARTFKVQGEGRPPANGTRKVSILVRAPDGNPVSGVRIDVLVSEARGEFLQDLVTDDAGEVRFSLSRRTAALDYVSATPPDSFWGASRSAIPLDEDRPALVMTLEPIADGYDDCVARMLAPATTEAGKGVQIAIIDAGSSLPDDIAAVAGGNFVDGEDPADVDDNGTGHGSHVAGIVHRVAPGASLRIYRVCAQGTTFAEELAISRAMHDAVDQNCDIINLSMGQPSEPPMISREVRRARSQGVVVVAATGNNWGEEVAYPARTPSVLAVTACGRSDGAPPGAIAERISAAPPADLDGTFFAKFSNYGPEVDFIAPGVAVISSVAKATRGVMDGTSMAAPVVTGLMARLLSADPALLRSDRTQQRSDDIVSACHKAAKALGFGRDYEGSGVIQS